MANPYANQADCCQAFAESYDLSRLPAMRRVEQSVLGCDYGGTSWTTAAQARDLIAQSDLGPGTHLLDIGSGSGWPALFVARESGCRAMLVDIPMNALQQAMARAVDDGTRARVGAVAASGAVLPFDDSSFDVVTHSDVLCCLPEKLEMLHECRRVIRNGSITVFSVIYIPQGLSEAEHVRAIEAGPPFIDAPAGYEELLEQTGWRLGTRRDVTADYRQSLVALVRAFDSDSELNDALGKEVISDSRARRQQQIDAIDAGLLLREIFVATAD